MEFKVYTAWHTMSREVAAQAADILTASFPREERRELEEIERLGNEGRVCFLTAEHLGEVQGVVLVWVLEELVFLENFAVLACLRGNGLGSKILDYVWQHWNKLIVLEVEPPLGPLERRRIGFYERNGFHLSGYPYLMPNLRGQGPALPLLLMTRPRPLEWQEAGAIVNRLYNTVYCGKIRPEPAETP